MDWTYLAGAGAVLYLLGKGKKISSAHPLTGLRVTHSEWGSGVVVDAASYGQLYIMFDGDSEPSGPYDASELTEIDYGG
jgi:hypothetical protein